MWITRPRHYDPDVIRHSLTHFGNSNDCIWKLSAQLFRNIASKTKLNQTEHSKAPQAPPTAW